jgi:hypothetical protein
LLIAESGSDSPKFRERETEPSQAVKPFTFAARFDLSF